MADQPCASSRDAPTGDLERLLGASPEALGEAPGRVNLIGAHLDYNEGPVLPVRVERRTWVAVRRRSDGAFRMASRERGAEAVVVPGHPGPLPDFVPYLLSAVEAARRRGFARGGFDLAVASDLPIGAGLSSSASLLVATIRALAALDGVSLDPREQADLAYRAETEGVGVPCGRMDPTAVALCRPGCALWFDCRTLEVEHVPLGSDRLALLVVDSGTRRALARSAFEKRVAECRQAADVLRRFDPTLRTLRDADEQLLERARGALGETLHRRARHVVTEVRRVHAFRAALERGDLSEAGRLVTECHRSLSRDYEVSTPELDELVDIAVAQPGIYGARLTGAGFGGNVVALAEREGAEQRIEEIVALARRQGIDARPVVVG